MAKKLFKKSARIIYLFFILINIDIKYFCWKFMVILFNLKMDFFDADFCKCEFSVKKFLIVL